MNRYRTHNCNELTRADVGQSVKLAGWVHRKRDHGGLVFIDLRDHFGLTQLVIDTDDAAFAEVEAVRNESVIAIEGTVKERTQETVNSNLPTGEIEVTIASFELLSACLLYTSPSPRDLSTSRMPSSA